jgi:hypothetical protein
MRARSKARFAGGGYTTSMTVQRPEFAPRFTQPSLPIHGGGATAGGPPYFPDYTPPAALAGRPAFKEGGKVKKKSKPKTSTASKRADGCCKHGKTRGRMR